VCRYTFASFPLIRVNLYLNLTYCPKDAGKTYLFNNQNFLPMVKQDLLTQSKGIPVFQYGLLSLLLIFFSLNAQGQGQIACNDLVQVSLDGNCEAAIRPSMILEGEGIAANFTHTVKVSGFAQTGTFQNPIVVKTPGLYTVTITNPGGNSCWGMIKVEDKLPPVVNCLCPVGNSDPACAFLCTDEAAFIAGTLSYPKPIATDNCSTVTVQFGDEIIPTQTCGAKVIRRTWIFTDASGNKSIPCVAEYRFNPVDIASVTPAYNNIQMTCGSDVSMAGIYSFFRAKLYAQYRTTYIAQIPAVYANIPAAEAAAAKIANSEAIKHAWPTVNGVPLNGQVCNLMAAKSDTDLAACGPECSNSKKVIRIWTILDWCLGTTRTITQIIKATDEEAPTVVAKDVSVSVDPWTCSANFLMPSPDILHDNCSATVNYTVQGPFGVNIVYDIPSGRYLVTGAPKGIHNFTYVATDCCKNEGRYDVKVTVYDKTPPIAVAKLNIVISLTTGGEGEGIAKLYTNSVDNGSYDSCTPVHLELRREDDPTRDEDGCGYTGNFTYNADGHPNDGSSNPLSPNYDPDNGAYVKFCCADITNREGEVPFGLVKVWMRVWDDGNMSGIYGDVVNGESDNYNETWVNVRVEDKLTPKIICPPNVTINCDEDITNLTLTGKATAYSNCLNLVTEYTDKEFLNSCKVGYVLRTWRIKSTPSIICVQRIDKRNPFPAFEGTINWPGDLTTNCTTDAANLKPTWTAGPCDQIGLSLKSDTFYFEGNACMKILNRWTVINWCTYDPNSSNPVGYYTRTQIIKVVDDVKPTLSSCADLMFEIDDHNDADNDGNRCERRNLMLTKVATDQGQCASNWLKWIVFVDLWGDGTYDYEYSSFLPSTDVTFNDTNGNGIKDIYVSATGQGGEVKITIPEDIGGSMSNHKVTWKVIDGCGNVTTCDQNFMVVDKKKPTPYCLNVSSALMQNGKVELWAVDFNLGSFDNCTSKSNLWYTLNEERPVATKLNQIHFFKGAGLNATEAEYNAGNAQKWLPAIKSSGMIFDCGDLPTSQVKMTVWDEKLNYDFCLVTLNLADNQGACGNVQTTVVSGKIISNKGKNIVGAEITMNNGIPEMTKSVITNNLGDYSFPNAVMHYDYSITGKKNDDYLNGVSTLDLVMIQRHVLDLERFNDAYSLIAADINSDQKVSASDLVELRKLILGIYEILPNNGSWKFINSNQTFADINNPWPLNERININDLDHAMNNQNFVSVKIGDVNGSATGNANEQAIESRSNVVLTADNQEVEANQVFVASFNADINKVYGLQFTLTLNNADLVDVYVGGNRVKDFNIAKKSANKYTVSWNDINAVSGKELISIQAVAKSNSKLSDMIELNSSITSAEVYSGENLQTGKLSLRFAGNERTEEFALFQNEPNPFQDKTNITFNLPEAGNATLKVMDVTGKVMYTQTRSFGKGLNTFTVTKENLPSSGVMIYKLESGSYTATKKMIGLE
jgi:hypothetical protein